MTRSLPTSAWSRFVKEINGSPRYDGLLFENLIRDLLERFFAGNWEATSRSWDGGRDFVDRSITGDSQWAECKMYRNNVGIRVLSPTLVMAILEGVRTLFLFSYSEVNGPAKRHLARLGRDQQMTIQIYDAAMLDQLILAAPDLLTRYFLVDTQCDQPVASPLWISALLTRDLEYEFTDLSISPIERLGTELPLDLFAPVILELFVKNQYPDRELSCIIDLSPLSKADSVLLRIGDEVQVIEKILLSPGEIRGLRYVLRAAQAGLHKVPNLRASVCDGDNCIGDEIEIHFPIKYIRASLIRHPPLIGSRYLRDLAELSSGIGLSNHFTTSLIHGRPGVGKSRYIEELGYRLVGAGRAVIHITPRNVQGLDWRSVVRSIVARLSAMPDPVLLDFDAGFSADDIVGTDTATRDEVTRFLYDKIPLDCQDFSGRALQLVQTRFRISPRILLIDDLQGFASEIISFFRSIIDCCTGMRCRSSVVIGVNIDLVAANRSAATLYSDLIDKLSSGTFQSGLAIYINEFNQGQVDEFIDNLLSSEVENRRTLFSAEYPLLMEQIQKKVEPRPLSLWQLIHLWIDQKFIIASERFFFIADIEGLRRSLNEAWRFLEGILCQRIALLRQNSRDWAVLQTATLFGEMTYADIRDLSIPTSAIERLVNQAFLRRNVSEDIEFYHDAVARALHSIVAEPDRSISELLDDVWVDDCRESIWKRRPFAALNLDIALQRTPLRSDWAIQACLVSMNPTYPSQRAAARLLEAGTKSGSPEQLLPVVLDLTRHAGMLDGRAGQTRRLIDLAPMFDQFRPASSKEARLLSDLIASTASQSLSDGYGAEAREYLEAWENQLSREILPSNKSVFVRDLRARVRNRMCVLYKDLGLPLEAVRRAKQSLRDCPITRDPFLACLNFVDLGYVYYGSFKTKTQTVREWTKASQLFEKFAAAILLSNPEAEYFIGLTEALSEAISGSLSSARSKIDRVVTRTRTKQHSYYFLQASVVAQIMFLQEVLSHSSRLQPSQQRLMLAGFQLLEDRVAATGIHRFLRPIQYGRAVCLLAARDPDWRGAADLLETLIVRGKAEPSATPLTRSIIYDWILASRHLDGPRLMECVPANRLAILGPDGESALEGRAPPMITTFWTNGFNLPYA